MRSNEKQHPFKYLHIHSRAAKEMSAEQIEAFNTRQKSGQYHPFTCDRGCAECEVNKDPRDYSKDGVLIANEDGLVCPCGKYTQKYSFSETK